MFWASFPPFPPYIKQFKWLNIKQDDSGAAGYNDQIKHSALNKKDIVSSWIIYVFAPPSLAQ
jgi:hypothetical protein